MGSMPLWKGAAMRTIRIQNNQWSLEHCPVLCIIQFAALFTQKCDLLPPQQPRHFLNGLFLQISKVYTYPPPPKERNFGALDQRFIKPRKNVKTDRVGALWGPYGGTFARRAPGALLFY